MNNSILNTKNLSIGYGTDIKGSIFSGINLSFIRGELVALLGKNGIGKSTLLRTLCGLQNPVCGDIIINAHNINSFSRNELAQKISFVSPVAVRINNMKVFDMVLLGRYPYTGWFGHAGTNDNTIAYESLEMAGIANLANRYVNEISDGERQRVIIARAIAQDTEIIIMDEPTAFLDLPNKYQIIKILKNLVETKKKFILFSTHDLNIALQTVSKILIMSQGKILEGAPEDLILNHAINNLLSGSDLSFNYNTGDINMHSASSESKLISIAGEGIELFWTIKALEREGFTVECDKSHPSCILIEKNNGAPVWICQNNNQRQMFNNIYDLIHYINLNYSD
ncbi:MAG: ABC transporter ATP-binding protein [Bacteroidia bacterium]|nr:ABC transporter ATP-binding protein [Bacteroidia bacterium]